MQTFDIDKYIANLFIDCVIFGQDDTQLKVLIGKLKQGNNLYNLSGGPILKTESVDQAAARLLTEERTQIKYLYLNQFKVFGVTNRITSSLHRELIIEEVLEKYEKMKQTRLQAVSYVSDIIHQLLFQK